MLYFPGQILAVRARFGLFHYIHFGVVSLDGGVVHNCAEAGQVVKSPIDEFAKGRPVRIVPANPRRTLWEIALEAERLIGQPYDLFRFNCEHFWRYCAGLEVRSPQITQASTFAVVIAVAGFVAARAG